MDWVGILGQSWLLQCHQALINTTTLPTLLSMQIGQKRSRPTFRCPLFSIVEMNCVCCAVPYSTKWHCGWVVSLVDLCLASWCADKCWYSGCSCCRLPTNDRQSPGWTPLRLIHLTIWIFGFRAGKNQWAFGGIQLFFTCLWSVAFTWLECFFSVVCPKASSLRWKHQHD